MTTKTKNHKKRASKEDTNRAADRIVIVDARKLKPSPENALLYRERTAGSSDYARLVESIRRTGVQAPLLVGRQSSFDR